MPFIDISLAGTRLTEEQRTRLQAETTRLMVEVMGKRREVTAVRIAEGPASHWAVNGAPVPRVAAHMDVKITTGTNTPAEKAGLIEQAHQLLAEVVDGLPEATYVVVHEVVADAWGFGGRTQADRSASK